MEAVVDVGFCGPASELSTHSKLSRSFLNKDDRRNAQESLVEHRGQGYTFYLPPLDKKVDGPKRAPLTKKLMDRKEFLPFHCG